MLMDSFTKAPVMTDHLLHSSGDLLNPHKCRFFSSKNDAMHFLWALIHSIGQCLGVDVFNKVGLILNTLLLFRVRRPAAAALGAEGGPGNPLAAQLLFVALAS